LCFTELGMFGYFFWMALLITTITSLSALTRSEIKTPADQQFIGAAYSLRAALFAFLVTGWFLSPTYTETLYILLGLAACLLQCRISTGAAQPLPVRPWARRTFAWELATMVMVYVAVKVRVL